MKFCEILVITVFALFVSSQGEGAAFEVTNSKTINSYGDVKFAEKRANGNYNVICENDSLEFNIPLSRLISGDVCSQPYISTEQSIFAQGEAIVLYYSNLPGGTYDWVGAYFEGDKNSDYLNYFYTRGRQSGRFQFCHLPAGRYQLRLFFDDSYQVEHELHVTIEDRFNISDNSCR